MERYAVSKEKEKLYKQLIHIYEEYVKIVGNGNLQYEWELREEIAEAKLQLKDFETKEKNVLNKGKM